MQRRLFVIAGLMSLALAIGAGACSNQGEGERCDRNDGNNGNDDCSSGLVCTATTIYAGVAGGATAICCPTTGCQTGSSAGVGTSDLSDAATAVDSATPDSASDASAGDSAVTDGAGDSAADSATDAATTATDSASDAALDSTAD